jgi:hypothetical protein
MCQFPTLCGKKFKRPADLDRHYRNVHASPEERTKHECDYKRCAGSNDPFKRKDHYRDHLRDFHKEDIESAKVGEYTPRKDHYRDHLKDYHKEDLGGSKDREHTPREKWETDQKKWPEEWNIDPKWWRCAKCLTRVNTENDGWECPSCNQLCESERIEHRQDLGNQTWYGGFEKGFSMRRLGSKFERNSMSGPLVALANVTAALLMGITFHWLSRSMSLGTPSMVMQEVCSALIAPTRAVKIVDQNRSRTRLHHSFRETWLRTSQQLIYPISFCSLDSARRRH